jgi:hypothetical protein
MVPNVKSREGWELYVTDGVMVGISQPLRHLSQYAAPILLCFSRHWAPSQHVHIGLPDDGILKYRNIINTMNEWCIRWSITHHLVRFIQTLLPEHFCLFVFLLQMSILKHTKIEMCTSERHRHHEQFIKRHTHQPVNQVPCNVIVTTCFEVPPHVTRQET